MGLVPQISFGQTHKYLGSDILRMRPLCLPNQILYLGSGQVHSQARPWVVAQRSCGTKGVDRGRDTGDNVQDEGGESTVTAMDD